MYIHTIRTYENDLFYNYSQLWSFLLFAEIYHMITIYRGCGEVFDWDKIFSKTDSDGL